MLSMILFISGGEIFIILLFILIFFGADQIPKFARMMGKAVGEFKKATDDIKREFNENTSGVMNDIRSIQSSLTESLTKEITEPLQETANEATKPFEETTKTFEEYGEQYNRDYYYDNQYDSGSYGNEYQQETQAPSSETANENSSDTSAHQADVNEIKPMTKIRKIKSATQKPNGEALDGVKPKTRSRKSNPKSKSAEI